MKQLDLLEAELKLLQDNIDRVREFEKETVGTAYSSLVFGELKHRCVSLKVRCTIINKLSTIDLFL